MGLFDVSDVNHPVEVDREVIGASGTYSEAEQNHKAFMFDDKNGVMAFPIVVVEDSSFTPSFSGMYFYNVDTNGISFKGRVLHYEDGSSDFSDVSKRIKRALYIGDYYYTVSAHEVLASWRDTLETVKEVLM